MRRHCGGSMKMLWVFGVAAAIASAKLLMAEPASHRSITPKEAHELVYTMLNADGWTKLRDFHLDKARTVQESPGFYAVYGGYYNPSGSGLIGDYAVEKTTGEVWYWNICARLTSPALLKAQHALRKRTGLTDADYQTLQRPGPSCESGEEPQILQLGRPTLEGATNPNKGQR